MNFFKRALTSIFRRPGKSAILLVLIFVLSNVIAGSVSVKSALANTEEAMLSQMSTEVKIEIDYRDAYDEVTGEFIEPEITVDMVDTIGMSEHVRSYDYSLNTSFEAKGVGYYYSENPEPIYTGGEEGSSWFQIIGGQSTTLQYIENGDITFIDGRIYTEEEIKSGERVMLVSEEFAKYNGLNIGSTVKLLYTIYDDSGMIAYKEAARSDYDIDIGIMPIERTALKVLEYEFKIIGTFTARPMKYVDWQGNLVEYDSQYLNSFFTNNNAINAMTDDVKAEVAAQGQENYMYSSTAASFILKHPDYAEIFESQNEQYLTRGLIFSNNADSFDSIRTPMANVLWIADIVMWVAVVATVLIISLLVTLFLRDRRHEMGIYLALGARKGAVAAQIVSEVLLVAILAVSLSIFSGNMLAENMSTTMLENQLAEEEKNMADDDQWGIYRSVWGGGSYEEDSGISADDVMEQYHVSLDARTVAFIYVVSIGSVLISTLIPIVYTLQLKPKKILM